MSGWIPTKGFKAADKWMMVIAASSHLKLLPATISCLLSGKKSVSIAGFLETGNYVIFNNKYNNRN